MTSHHGRCPSYFSQCSESMLAPKCSLKQLLMGIAVAAVFCSVAGVAANGSMIAYGLCLAILTLALPLTIYAIVYWTLYWVTRRAAVNRDGASEESG